MPCTVSPGKEALEELYIKEKKTAGEIGAIYGVPRKTVYSWAREAGIKKRPVTSKKPDKETLYRLYVTENLPCAEIGEMYGVGASTVREWARGDHINGFRKHGPVHERPPKEELEALFNGKRTPIRKIAGIYGVSPSTVSGWLRFYGIKKEYDGYGSSFPGSEKLRRMYFTSRMSIAEIALECHVSLRTVYRWTEMEGISGRRAHPTKCPADAYFKRLKAEGRLYPADVAGECGVSEKTAYRWIREKELASDCPKRKPLPDADELYRMYVEQDMSTKELAQEFGLSVSGMSSHLSKAGVRKYAGHPDADTLKGLLGSGMSVRAIAAKYRVTDTAVYNWIKKFGLSSPRAAA